MKTKLFVRKSGLAHQFVSKWGKLLHVPHALNRLRRATEAADTRSGNVHASATAVAKEVQLRNTKCLPLWGAPALTAVVLQFAVAPARFVSAAVRCCMRPPTRRRSHPIITRRRQQRQPAQQTARVRSRLLRLPRRTWRGAQSQHDCDATPHTCFKTAHIMTNY